MSTITQYTPEIIERFYSKISKIPTEQGCLEWMSSRNYRGYGVFYIGKEKIFAHRVAWEIVNGPIPPGLVIRHMCHNSRCVSVAHLQTGTQADNIHDMMRSGRWKNAPNTYVRPVRPTREERFYAQISTTPTDTGCLEWLGCLNEHGYGVFNFPGKSNLAHRIAWELAHGPIPDGMMCLHKCDNPRCVNVESHIWLGTAADNARDRVEKGRSNHATRFGEDIGTSKLTAEQVKDIRSPKYENWAGTDIAAQFGVAPAVICGILNRRSWRHLDSSDDLPIRKRHARGEQNHTAKLTEAEVLKIRSNFFAGWTHREIAEYIGISAGVISCVLRRKTWAHLDGSGDAPIAGEEARGRHTRGTRNNRAKLTEAQVLEIRSDEKAGWTQRELAKHFGITQNAVWCIRHRVTWRHI